MSGDKVEAFKARFMTKGKLAAKLATRLDAAEGSIRSARTKAATLPDRHAVRIALNAELDTLQGQVDTQRAAGAADPGSAWRAMAPICEQAVEKKNDVSKRVSDAANVESNHRVRFNTGFAQVMDVLDAGRAIRRDLVDDREAVRLGTVLDDVRQRLHALADAVNTVPYSTETRLAELDTLRTEAEKAHTAVDAARTSPAGPNSQRASSRAVVDALTGVEVFDKRLNTGKRDARGRTPMDEVRARLEAFDEHFAQDEGAEPDAKRKNAAMRVAATVSVTAREIAAEVNDPYLQPRIAQSLIAEYEGDIARGIAAKANPADASARVAERQVAEKAVQLARALVMDDPVTKLLTGKIRPEDAVQRMRDMAAVGGEPPSEMLRLLRQQAEIRLGSTTGKEVRAGEKGKDKDQAFVLSDTMGELSAAQFAGIVETTQGLDKLGVKPVDDLPVWQDGTNGTGLKLRAGGQQLHTVKDGDTLRSLASAYLGGSDADIDQLINANKAVLVPANGAPPPGNGADKPNSLQRQQPAQLALAGYGPDKRLPVGATLRVPAQASILDQLAPYVAAWDVVELGNGEAKPVADDPPVALVARPDNLPRITPEQLQEAAARLTDPRATNRNPNGDDRAYIPAPGIGQEARTPGPLTDPWTEVRVKNAVLGTEMEGVLDRLGALSPEDWDTPAAEPLHQEMERLAGEMLRNRQEAEAAEADAKRGAINARQYAHLRLLQRADEEDKENFLAENGQTVESWVLGELAKRYDTTRSKAEGMLRTVLAAIETVPISLTFTADRLFSSPDKDEPTFGTQYGSEVVYSRGTKEMADLIGRGDTVSGQVGVTGGKDTGWTERGTNYMRWRREKDSREGRRNELAYEDQQIFAAANPNFNELKGGASGSKNPDKYGTGLGTNFYGEAHFLLRDEVRSRVAFAVRGGGISIGGGKSASQRKDLIMMIHDMLRERGANARYLDALLMNATGKDKVLMTGLDWEVHLYGGFDMSKDAKAMFLPPGLDAPVLAPIARFAVKHGLEVLDYGRMPTGLEVMKGNVDVKQFKLGDA